ncbi:MAG: hypothetical protein AAF799_33715 [Myxococcota bacterium]
MSRSLPIVCSLFASVAGCASTSSPAHAPGAGSESSSATEAESPPPVLRWRAMSADGAPVGREDHSAIWTGQEMIVWGGETRGGGNQPLDSGARYVPAEDRWAPISSVGVPDRRNDHTAVWTGTEMIVWGGNQRDEDSELLASGGRYDPAHDRWTPTAGGPLSPRDDPTAVWTGTEMIIWGGRTLGMQHVGSGARYSPYRDAWVLTSTQGAPEPREDHTAVWTGTEMIVWGGWSGYDDDRHHHGDGGRYDPETDTWRTMSTVGAPEPREDHTAVWTGTEMIVWGGVVHRYAEPEPSAEAASEHADEDASEDAEAPEAAEAIAIERVEPELEDALDDAEEVSFEYGKGGRGRLVQLGNGAAYDPVSDTWRPITTVGAPEPREDHVAVWLGDELLVWGGRRGTAMLATGALYDPRRDRWRPVSADEPPTARWNHTAVLAGDQVIIWGGYADGYPQRGARIVPSRL